MSQFDDGPEDPLIGRLRGPASGDVAVRQLRRRYDALRADYEHLLDRLGELEDRLDAPAPPPPTTTAAPLGEGLAEAIAAPLLRLRDDYLAAVLSLQRVATGLDGLAGGFKAQRGSPAPVQGGTPVPAEDDAPHPPRQQKVQVDVKGSGFGELLDFQERLSQLVGVVRVSISAIDNERATLVVELDRESQ